MTFERKVYLRKKEGRYCFETKVHGKTIHLIDLPKNYYKFLHEMSRLLTHLPMECKQYAESSFFSPSKWINISQKLASADYNNKAEEKSV